MLAELCSNGKLQVILLDKPGILWGTRRMVYLRKLQPSVYPWENLLLDQVTTEKTLTDLDLVRLRRPIVDAIDQWLYANGLLTKDPTKYHRRTGMATLLLFFLLIFAPMLLPTVYFSRHTNVPDMPLDNAFNDPVFTSILLGIIALTALLLWLRKSGQASPTTSGQEAATRCCTDVKQMDLAHVDTLRTKPALFEAYLPYAFAMDVGEEWLRQGKRLGLPAPNWIIHPTANMQTKDIEPFDLLRYVIQEFSSNVFPDDV